MAGSPLATGGGGGQQGLRWPQVAEGGWVRVLGFPGLRFRNLGLGRVFVPSGFRGMARKVAGLAMVTVGSARSMAPTAALVIIASVPA